VPPVAALAVSVGPTRRTFIRGGGVLVLAFLAGAPPAAFTAADGSRVAVAIDGAIVSSTDGEATFTRTATVG